MGKAGDRLPRRFRLVHDVGKQAEKARTLDRPRQLALLLGRHRGDAARHDLAALGDEALQQPDVLVIDLRRVGSGERAGFAPPEKRPAGGGRRAAARCALAFHLGLHRFRGRRFAAALRCRRLRWRALDGALRYRLAAFAWLVAVAAFVTVAVAARPVLAAAAALHDWRGGFIEL